jgi:hypothetical protein
MSLLAAHLHAPGLDVCFLYFCLSDIGFCAMYSDVRTTPSSFFDFFSAGANAAAAAAAL